ncbi:hypothetical protein MKX01_031607 [Papaver californicum]|nr:hypothetical protein MKX01_031607 [Papaver californicum]
MAGRSKSVIICWMWLRREGIRRWSRNCMLSRTRIESQRKGIETPSTIAEFDAEFAGTNKKLKETKFYNLSR